MQVYCYCENCIYRSKRKSSAVNKAGQPMYKCTRKSIVVGEMSVLDASDTAECISAEMITESED